MINSRVSFNGYSGTVLYSGAVLSDDAGCAVPRQGCVIIHPFNTTENSGSVAVVMQEGTSWGATFTSLSGCSGNLAAGGGVQVFNYRLRGDTVAIQFLGGSGSTGDPVVRGEILFVQPFNDMGLGNLQ